MSIHIRRSLLSLLAAASVTCGVCGDQPLGTAFTYQGQMKEGGSLLDVTCDFQFSLWDASSGGVQVGSTDNALGLEVVDGLFTVQLDFGSVFNGSARWLEIAVRYPAGEGGYTTLTPRQELTGAPYALHARTAGSVTGGVTGTGTPGYLPVFTGTDVVASSTVHETGAGDIGVGTPMPGARFDVRGDEVSIRVSSPSDPIGRYVDMLYHGSIGPLVRAGDGYNRLTPDAMWGDAGTIVLGRNGDRVGIGTIDPVAKLEVRADGEALARAGDFRADDVEPGYGTHVLHAEFTGSTNQDPIAVYGLSEASDNSGVGGWFQGGYVGVQGQVYATEIGNYYGARAGANGGSGTNYGVYGYAQDGTTNYGVYGIAAGGTTNYAGYFEGDVHVAGTLSKSAGSFKIDHPRDPESKYLAHAFVESPDMMNVYNGNAILDDQGRAEIVLPDYFDALNREFRYQLTPIGAAMPDLHVAVEISRNRFRIAGGEPGLKVSWQVTGIRRDPFAEMNRIEVEPYKEPEHRGLFLNPEAYGLPESFRIGAADEKPIAARKER